MSSIAEAASVLLARGPGSPEVLVVRRAENLRFFGGFLAFPGGKVAATDAEVLPLLSPSSNSATKSLHIRCITAARELFEEAGVLLARRADGTFPASGSELTQWRREMVEDRLTFPDVLRRLDLRLRAEDFILIGNLTTPEFVPIRFDTTFFVSELPPHQQVEIWPGELDEGTWATAADVLDRWTRGGHLVSPPTIAILEAIRGRPVAEAPARLAPLLASLAAGAIPPIHFVPDVLLIPLRTVALPPSTHTNAYLVGRGISYLFDPGTTHADEQQRLFAILDAHQTANGPLTAIVLTHHHPDHVGAATACAQRYRVPIWAHPLTARALTGKIEVARMIQHGDRLELGCAPDGNGTWHLEAIHTPGHAAGHLVFYEPRYKSLLAGDMVSTLSSIVIAPPDGDLAVYMESLRRLQQLDCRMLLPAHGGPSPRPRQVIDESIAHRLKREEQLLAALASGPRKVTDLAPELYKGIPANLMRFAELQVQAGLLKLQREGRVEASGDEMWQLC